MHTFLLNYLKRDDHFNMYESQLKTVIAQIGTKYSVNLKTARKMLKRDIWKMVKKTKRIVNERFSND